MHLPAAPCPRCFRCLRPENINLDNPVEGDRFALAVQCYDCVPGANSPKGPAKPAHPRVNVYRDGELAAGVGYDPSRPAGSAQYPQLLTEGQSSHGAMWVVGELEWLGPQPLGVAACKYSPTGQFGIGAWNKDAWHAQANGSAAICVNNGPLDSGSGAFDPPQSVGAWRFRADGGYPDWAGGLCSY